jgi:hypothetical protein
MIPALLFNYSDAQMTGSQGCQIFLVTTYQIGEKYNKLAYNT